MVIIIIIAIGKFNYMQDFNVIIITTAGVYSNYVVVIITISSYSLHFICCFVLIIALDGLVTSVEGGSSLCSNVMVMFCSPQFMVQGEDRCYIIIVCQQLIVKELREEHCDQDFNAIIKDFTKEFTIDIPTIIQLMTIIQINENDQL